MIRVLVNPTAPAFDLWWEAAEAIGGSAPGLNAQNTDGGDVINVNEFEPADLKAWASTITGWNPHASDDALPLLFQSTDDSAIT